MARINNDTDWVNTTLRRDIKRQHFSQDAYFYRDRVNRLRPNSRAPYDYQKKIQNALEITNEIWNKKPPCWRDHFYRATLKTKIEGSSNPVRYRELTGYHLYVSKQMFALKKLDGNYYNPVCFCIQPRDWVGWRLNAYGRFYFKNDLGLHYLYDETKKLLHFENCDYIGRDPFRSAGFLYNYNLAGGFLNCNFTMKRVIDPYNRDLDFYDIKDAVMWFPLHLKLVSGLGPSEINLWDCCYWKINQVNICDCDRDGEPVNCIDGVFMPPQYKESQCYDDHFGFSMKYNSKGVVIQLSGTDQPPFYKVFWRDNEVGEFGVGPGGFRSVACGEGGGSPVQDLPDTMGLGDHLDPCPLGRQPCHDPDGVQVPATLDHIDIGGPCLVLGGARRTDYFYDFGGAVTCEPKGRTPELRFTTTPPVYDDQAGFNPAPWGAITIYYFDENGTLWPFSPFARDIVFQPGKQEYCINNYYYKGKAVGLRATVSSDLIGNSCNKTELTGLGLLKRGGYTD